MIQAWKPVPLFLLFLFAVLILLAGPGSAARPQQETEIPGSKVEAEAARVSSGPANIKEKTGVIVFVVWVWAVIVVLGFVLREKAREADRLHELKFDSDKGP